MRYLLLAAVMLATLAGCTPPYIAMKAPDGPPEFRQGWIDGCDTGFSVEETFYAFTKGYTRNVELSDNVLYKSGWNEGFTFCRFHANNQMKLEVETWAPYENW